MLTRIGSTSSSSYSRMRTILSDMARLCFAIVSVAFMSMPGDRKRQFFAVNAAPALTSATLRSPASRVVHFSSANG